MTPVLQPMRKNDMIKGKFKLSMPEPFKKGDKISLNTGFACDRGTFIRMEDGKVVWKDRFGGIYKSPLSQYKITKVKTI